MQQQLRTVQLALLVLCQLEWFLNKYLGILAATLTANNHQLLFLTQMLLPQLTDH
jgi:hypothetical protein